MDDTIEEFLSFCEECFEKDCPNLCRTEKEGLVKLLKKRMNSCSKDFIQSREFRHLLKSIWKKIRTDPSKIFVHIRDLNEELKAYRAVDPQRKFSGLKRSREGTPVSDDSSAKQARRGLSPFEQNDAHSATSEKTKLSREQNDNSDSFSCKKTEDVSLIEKSVLSKSNITSDDTISEVGNVNSEISQNPMEISKHKSENAEDSSEINTNLDICDQNENERTSPVELLSQSVPAYSDTENIKTTGLTESESMLMCSDTAKVKIESEADNSLMEGNRTLAQPDSPDCIVLDSDDDDGSYGANDDSDCPVIIETDSPPDWLSPSYIHGLLSGQNETEYLSKGDILDKTQKESPFVETIEDDETPEFSQQIEGFYSNEGGILDDGTAEDEKCDDDLLTRESQNVEMIEDEVITDSLEHSQSESCRQETRLEHSGHESCESMINQVDSTFVETIEDDEIIDISEQRDNLFGQNRTSPVETIEDGEDVPDQMAEAHESQKEIPEESGIETCIDSESDNLLRSQRETLLVETIHKDRSQICDSSLESHRTKISCGTPKESAPSQTTEVNDVNTPSQTTEVNYINTSCASEKLHGTQKESPVLENLKEKTMRNRHVDESQSQQIESHSSDTNEHVEEVDGPENRLLVAETIEEDNKSDIPQETIKKTPSVETIEDNEVSDRLKASHEMPLVESIEDDDISDIPEASEEQMSHVETIKNGEIPVSPQASDKEIPEAVEVSDISPLEDVEVSDISRSNVTEMPLVETIEEDISDTPQPSDTKLPHVQTNKDADISDSPQTSVKEIPEDDEVSDIPQSSDKEIPLVETIEDDDVSDIPQSRGKKIQSVEIIEDDDVSDIPEASHKEIPLVETNEDDDVSDIPQSRGEKIRSVEIIEDDKISSDHQKIPLGPSYEQNQSDEIHPNQEESQNVDTEETRVDEETTCTGEDGSLPGTNFPDEISDQSRENHCGKKRPFVEVIDDSGDSEDFCRSEASVTTPTELEHSKAVDTEARPDCSPNSQTVNEAASGGSPVAGSFIKQRKLIEHETCNVPQGGGNSHVDDSATSSTTSCNDRAHVERINKLHLTKTNRDGQHSQTQPNGKTTNELEADSSCPKVKQKSIIEESVSQHHRLSKMSSEQESEKSLASEKSGQKGPPADDLESTSSTEGVDSVRKSHQKQLGDLEGTEKSSPDNIRTERIGQQTDSDCEKSTKAPRRIDLVAQPLLRRPRRMFLCEDSEDSSMECEDNNDSLMECEGTEDLKSKETGLSSQVQRESVMNIVSDNEDSRLENGDSENDVVVIPDSPMVVNSKKKETFHSMLSDNLADTSVDTIPESPYNTESNVESDSGQKHATRGTESSTDVTDEKMEGPSKNTTDKKKSGSARQIRRLEKLLKDISDEIEKLRSREMSMEDMDDDCSDYIKEDKLQKKFVKVWEKLCQLKGRQSTTGRPTEKEFKYQGTRFPEVNRRIQRFVNKKKIFPDYHDIRNLVRAANNKYNLGISSSALERISREAFTDVGNKLQQRRQADFISNFGSAQIEGYSSKIDPALYDPELRKKLNESQDIAKRKMEKVLNKYADMEMASGEVAEVVKTDNEDSDEDPKSPVSDLDLDRHESDGNSDVEDKDTKEDQPENSNLTSRKEDMEQNERMASIDLFHTQTHQSKPCSPSSGSVLSPQTKFKKEDSFSETGEQSINKPAFISKLSLKRTKRESSENTVFRSNITEDTEIVLSSDDEEVTLESTLMQKHKNCPDNGSFKDTDSIGRTLKKGESLHVQVKVLEKESSRTAKKSSSRSQKPTLKINVNHVQSLAPTITEIANRVLGIPSDVVSENVVSSSNLVDVIELSDSD